MPELLGRPLVALFLGLFAAARRRDGRRPAARAARRRRRERAATLANLNERITSWWAIVAILAVAFALGPLATILLFALVSFWCLREFTSLTPTPVADHYALAAAFYLFLPLQYLLLWDDWYGLFAIAIPVYGFLLLPLIAVLSGETRDFLPRIAKVQWALMLAVYCASHAPALLLLDVPGRAGGELRAPRLPPPRRAGQRRPAVRLRQDPRPPPHRAAGQPEQDLGGLSRRRRRRDARSAARSAG